MILCVRVYIVYIHINLINYRLSINSTKCMQCCVTILLLTFDYKSRIYIKAYIIVIKINIISMITTIIRKTVIAKQQLNKRII